MKKYVFIGTAAAITTFLTILPRTQTILNESARKTEVAEMREPEPAQPTHPLQIREMRKREYPGSDLRIEQTLANGSNYTKDMSPTRTLFRAMATCFSARTIAGTAVRKASRSALIILRLIRWTF